MEKVELNLTRKWRSKNFQEIIGQPLAVRILQNSLYLKQFFPVYLFAGQRGCGKTSTARIFAAAVNCARLPEFQQDPRKVTIPCLSCESCVAMSKGQHPDFIEIDAASHTGVDNVRNIIDASSFLPLLSSKKIYLIDEAHMLSKAAFNAFLKILEEPPMSVIFILATTDVHKILETVKSRCFQIFFDSVDVSTIVDHLENLCIAENISFEETGLAVIAKEAGGSVRDAINLLEQVRFATKKISKEAVLSILGHVSEATLLQLFECIVQEQIQDLLIVCASLEKHELSIEYVWSQLTELVYDAILIKYQVAPRQFVDLPQQYKKLIDQTSVDRLAMLFAMLCGQEQNLARTTKKLRYFEMILLQHVQGQVSFQESKKKINSFDVQVTQPVESSVVTGQDRWQKFVKNMQGCDDLVLVTMIQEAQFIDFDEKNCVVSVSFLKKFMFFQDILEKEKSRWLLVLQNVFGHQIKLQSNFELVADQQKPVERQIVVQQNRSPKPLSGEQAQMRVVGKTLDISDASQWKLAHELMKHFDGTITEISGDVYE
ncbi:DNA polymerase III subunit gamma/tau [Candidatus Babeliales bacterium]|nr:DNA polymerase III subunit gamma/tau [Candidatus Babeliales bacterium]MBP9843715.1 DNA polymerase III subunit gamma/tau [Candidatus Babeliales bacterium]